ncbi:immunoglobulin alpha Fc receptor isoform X5 [Sapajus apella]|uniref:immunoglobulin alpha Fc receptor isoform X5 n=1 Tax=Sapajus apella TaxID=9515 RepID=UPI00137B35F9|nr:immunoglobulin alpha Fc receptor isoform X5 [Sapajus apella]
MCIKRRPAGLRLCQHDGPQRDHPPLSCALSGPEDSGTGREGKEWLPHGGPPESGLYFLPGDFPMPLIFARSSPVVPRHGSAKIQCQSSPESFLTQLVIQKNSTYKEVDRKLGFLNESEFIVDHMDTNTAGRYHCRYRRGFTWSHYSNALELVVTGLYDKPFLSADRGRVVRPGENISFTCTSAHLPFDRFSLAKEGELSLPQHQSGEHPANFSLGPLDVNVSGSYRCYGWYSSSPYVWSAPSNALELVVTGMYDTPTLSVHPGPEVILGEKVTFYCHLGTATSTFFLLKEGRSSVRRGYGKVQAEFPMGSVTTSHRGTYRCFGSYNNHAWSFPSEPVKLLITGDTENTSLAPTDPTSPDSGDTYLLTTDMGLQKELALWDHTAQNLLRAGLAFLVLVALVWLLVEDWLSRKRTREPASRASTRHCRRSLNTKTL